MSKVTRARVELVRHGVTQRSVAKSAGVDYRKVQDILVGRRKPLPSVVVALVAATGLTEDELFEPAL